MSSELPAQDQLARLQRSFVHGWVSVDTGEADDVPVREPYADGLDESNYEFSVEEFEGVRCVVLEFSYYAARGVRFRHRFAPPTAGEPDFSDVHSMEMVESNKLTRSRARVGPEARVVWTDFSRGHPADRLGRVMALLIRRDLASAASVLRGVEASEWDLELADDIASVVADGAPDPTAVQMFYTRCRHEMDRRGLSDEEMAHAFWEEHVRRRE